MSQGIPKLKASELVNRISSLSNDDIKNQFIINGISREIEGLKKTNASKAYALSGQLAFVIGEYKKAKHEFQKSFGLDRYDIVVLNNYATSLSQAGLHHEAYDAFVAAYEVGKDRLSLGGLFISSLAMFHLDEAFDHASQLSTMFPDDDSLFQRKEIIGSAIKYFQSHNIKQEEGSILMDVVWDTLVSNKVSNSLFYLAPVKSSDSYSFTIFLDQSPEFIAELNLEIFMNLAEKNISGEIVDKLIVCCMPLNDSVMEKSNS